MKKENTEKVKVSVVCLTYNHGKLLETALQSFLSQETDFAFEVIVHDDASTDGTKELLKKYEEMYPGIIVSVIQKENQYWKCPIFPTYVMPKIRGEYVAICDGDDYWIDNSKLNKQVEFMDKHQDCTLYIHNGYREYMEDGRREILNTFKTSGFYSHRENVQKGIGTDFPVSSSMLLRADILKSVPSFFVKTKALDYPLRQYCACKGRIYYSEDAMSVYRVNTPTSFMKKTVNDNIFYRKYTLEMIEFFENYNIYTNGRFENLLKMKIVSDYYGFCSSFADRNYESFISEIKTYGIEFDRVAKYWEKITDENVDKRIIQLKERSKHMYIYGTSRLACICARQLRKNNVEFDGFVVSDGQMKLEVFEESRVFYLSEVEGISKCGFVIAVQPINAHFLVENLKKYECNMYCIPYAE